MKDRYAAIAGSYDALCALGSLGAVGRCKRDALRVVRPGDSVLFAGAGTGEEALEAAQAGAQVTVCDLSPAMIARLRAKPGSESLRIVPGDILDFDERESFDVVIANFFLNVFSPAPMRAALEKLTKLTGPKGTLVIGDVVLPEQGTARAFTGAYWFAATRLFATLTANAVHPVYDYEAGLSKLGFVVTDRKIRRLLGASCFASLTAGRRDERGPVS